MWDHLPSVLAAIPVILALAALAGYGSTRARIADLRGQLEDSRTEAKELRERDGRREAENLKLKADLDSLARHLTGEVHWSAIQDLLIEHHGEAQQHWRELDEHLVAGVDRLARLLTREDGR